MKKYSIISIYQMIRAVALLTHTRTTWNNVDVDHKLLISGKAVVKESTLVDIWRGSGAISIFCINKYGDS